MLNPISTALSRIYNTIPKAVLEAAFQPFEYDVSLDELIKQKVILGRVHADFSQRAGKQKDIILQLGWAHYTPPPKGYAALAVTGSYSVFTIPAEARDYRDITCVENLRFPYALSQGDCSGFLSNCAMSGNTAGSLACAALQNQTKSGMVPMPMAQVLPGNIIKLTPETISWVPWICRCRLAYDEDFSGMDVNVIQTFNLICEYAVKAYCYNELLFKVESNVVYRGMELGVIRDIINGYSDANEKYDEQLLASNVDIMSPDRLRNILIKCMPTG